MPTPPQFQEIRDDLHEFVRRRLLGPGGAADLAGQTRLIDLANPAGCQPELLQGTPTGIYYTGILFPPARLREGPPESDPEPAAPAAEAPADPDDSADSADDDDGPPRPAAASIDPDEATATADPAAGPGAHPWPLPPADDGDPADDDLALPADPLQNFNQLYPRHIGLSACVAATTPTVALRLDYRCYRALPPADKQRVALVLTDYATNPHYRRLLADADYGPVLGRYFALREDHPAGPLLVVRAVPAADEYAGLDGAIRRLGREADALFRSKAHRGATSTDPTNEADDHPDEPAGRGEQALLRQWDQLRYAPDPAGRASAEFAQLTAQVENLQQLHYAYQAFRRLALPLRSADAYNTYWLEQPASIALTLPLATYQPLLRHGRYDTCWVYAAAAPAQPCAPAPAEAAGQHLRVRLLLRQVPQAPDELFLKVQVENFSEPVFVDAGGPYPSFDARTAERCVFGLSLTLVPPAGLRPYRAVGSPAGEGSPLAEEATTAFIYRHAPPYAVGHGVAAEWEPDPATGAVAWAKTNYLPSRDVPDISPKADHPLSPEPGAPLLPHEPVLRLQWLADFGPEHNAASDEQVLADLHRFLDYYQHWIATQTQAATRAEPEKLAAIEREMGCCQRDLARMRRNVGLLGRDPAGLRAFRLANAAMFVQLWHGRHAGKQTWRPHDPANAVLSQMRAAPQPGFSPGFYAQVSDRLRANEPAAWRPFQLAFLLLNLDGFLRPDPASTQAIAGSAAVPAGWYERNELVDLVWFPTGGGKTEAYLGLIAFCALHRRLAYPGVGGGTAVLMRYTLRLLTLQQFQRATRLLVALEIMRHWPAWRAKLSAEPHNPAFSIGLWVGSKFLPNKLRAPAARNGPPAPAGLLDLADTLRQSLLAKQKEYQQDPSPENLRKLESRARAECGKIPLVACPCCGTELFDVAHGLYGGPLGQPRESGADDGNAATFSCLAPGCLFGPAADDFQPSPALPVLLCDELLYQRPPTLLFGTVDKFAALAHKVSEQDVADDTRRLFGRRRARQPPQRPPDLIIQDELHLLQGPLGSSVALFETVLDRLCRVPDAAAPGYVRAKVISSTATTRNTGLQVWALYDRAVNVFPKPGLHAADSFFAVYERDPATGRPRSRRRYLGICPTGKTMMLTQRHLLGLLLAHRLWAENRAALAGPDRAATRDEAQSQLLDAHYSVVVYFGSLREVGKTASQLDTFLQADYLRLLEELLLTQPLHYSYRYLRSIELTGRMSDNQVKAALAQAEEPYRLALRQQHQRPTPDLLLATSMISVGIDIGRLNVLLVNGMPKSMAKYIQASSRVAREHAGLVLTLHHPLRPRDVSHFEHFTSFHNRLYAYVEPLSITPFTAKALARYWPTVLAALVRQTQAAFAANTSAGSLQPLEEAHLQEELVTTYFQQRHERLQRTDPRTVGDDARHLLGSEELAELARQTTDLLRRWVALRDQVQGEQAENPELNRHLAFGPSAVGNQRLYADLNASSPSPGQWPVNYSLREIEPQTALKIEQA